MGMRRHGAAVLAALGVVGATAACDAVQEATDKASICVDALQIAGFTPNTDPKKAVSEAKEASEKLEKLANQTPDESLKEALNGMSTTIGEFSPGNAAEWTKNKASQLNALTRACG